MTIISEINAIVTENGGTASTDGTIIGALDALADTLAGENVERQASITNAIEALAPYIAPAGPQLSGRCSVKNTTDDPFSFTATVEADADAVLLFNVAVPNGESMDIAGGLYLMLEAEAIVRKVEGYPPARTVVSPDYTDSDEGYSFYLVPAANAFTYEVSWD